MLYKWKKDNAPYFGTHFVKMPTVSLPRPYLSGILPWILKSAVTPTATLGKVIFNEHLTKSLNKHNGYPDGHQLT
ncbi:hypothetical protein CEXT_280071 [Caerostris extrusa]|uniref:Uncharacterized protein n=1 Tax=Caerostris extrusa TaxID=172846 RepID=A0AAV4XYF4_CAEEX|nr:hypothetical protein CEXT_280071 [Caerostris extrusa]